LYSDLEDVAQNVANTSRLFQLERFRLLMRENKTELLLSAYFSAAAAG
jgi:hypothetical protein